MNHLQLYGKRAVLVDKQRAVRRVALLLVVAVVA